MTLMRSLAGLTAFALLLAACDGDNGEDGAAVESEATGTTSTSASGDGEADGACAEPRPAEDAEPADDAVAADLDGDSEKDTAWVIPDLEIPRLEAVVGEGWLGIDLPEGPVIEPAIESVLDIGDDRDTLLVRVGSGAYTELFSFYGVVDCELEALFDAEDPEPGPFTLARGASVQNGADFWCSERDHGTVITGLSWTTGETGEFEWVETTYVRQGATLAVLGEPVEGTAATEEEIGTGGGGECPAPGPA